MSTLSWKVRIAVIWAIGPMLHVAHLLYFTRVEDWGKYQGDVVLQSTVLLLLPLTFCVLSLTLKDKPNRWVNIIAGIFFAFLSYPVAWLELGLGVIMYEGPPLGAEYALILGFRMVITFLIPWFAWKWPKQESLPI